MFYEGYEGGGLNEDLAALGQYLRGIRLPPPGAPPLQRRRIELPPESDSESDSEEEIPLGDTYFTLTGDEYGMPLVVKPPTYTLTLDLMTGYMRNLVRFLPYYDNLNDAYPKKTEADKENLRRFFELPMDFVDSFTPNWNVMTVFQFNKTKEKYYLLVVISNGIYTELEMILHMYRVFGDPYNIKIYEAYNYDSINDVPLGRLNVSWNDFTQAIQHDHPSDYHELYGVSESDVNVFMQLMLLSFYRREPPPGAPMGLGKDGVSRIEQQPWFSAEKTDTLNTFINSYGRNIDSYMYVHKQQILDERIVLVEDIIHH